MGDDTYAFPARQKHLLILLIRKVLGSSPTALCGTLEIIKKRLQELFNKTKEGFSVSDIFIKQTDIDEDLLANSIKFSMSKMKLQKNGICWSSN
jgi:hypothetical protein